MDFGILCGIFRFGVNYKQPVLKGKLPIIFFKDNFKGSNFGFTNKMREITFLVGI
jgi:hypothetical protein